MWDKKKLRLNKSQSFKRTLTSLFLITTNVTVLLIWLNLEEAGPIFFKTWATLVSSFSKTNWLFSVRPRILSSSHPHLGCKTAWRLASARCPIMTLVYVTPRISPSNRKAKLRCYSRLHAAGAWTKMKIIKMTVKLESKISMMSMKLKMWQLKIIRLKIKKRVLILSKWSRLDLQIYLHMNNPR